MSQSSIDLMIGGGISLLSSILMLVLSYIFNSMNDKKTRQRTLDDRKYERRLAILSIRINEAQNEANSIFDMCLSVHASEHVLILSRSNPNYPDTVFIEKQQELHNKFHNMNRLSGLGTSLGTLELAGMRLRLQELLNAEIDEMKRLEKLIRENEEFDQEVEAERISQFFRSASFLHDDIIEALDQLATSTD